MHEPSVKELRAVFEPESKRRSYAFGVSLVVLMSVVSAGAFAGIVLSSSVAIKILLSIVLGLGISFLFVIGHDACHDSLTPSHTLNQVLGRICFMPTLHPYVAWELGHNRLHHGWTNLKGVDYVYPPFSPEEFRALPAWRRGMERIYRTALGIGLFYFMEVWWRHMVFPRREDFAKLRRGAFAIDFGLVAIFLIAQLSVAIWLAPTWPMALLNVACTVLIPYAMWNWLMAFVTFQHHTHPQAPWFNDIEEWSFFHGQVHGTIHVRLPRWMEILFHNILDHTAHHVDPKIPLYKLTSCQKQLENAFPSDVVIMHTSLPALRRVLRVCKLYDYERHCWLDFQGRPSAPPVPMYRWQQATKESKSVSA